MLESLGRSRMTPSGKQGTTDLSSLPGGDRLGRVAGGMVGWEGVEARFDILLGGLANLSYTATIGASRFVVKLLTPAMGTFGLMIPLELVIGNTERAGMTGVGARVLATFPEEAAVVLEYIDGRTLDTPDLSEPTYIPRIGAAVRKLHSTAAPFPNVISIWSFLDDYLALVDTHGLDTPAGLTEHLPVLRRIEAALAVNPLPLVPSHNDLLAKNLMDDGSVRLIDYDFSGMNDPCFDLGDVGMEGDYSQEQTEALCEAYFGEAVPTQVARARLFGIAAQYTWSLLFVGMNALLSPKPDPAFDYWGEAVSRWQWTLRQLEDQHFGALLDRAAS
jgi:thiamine kinase-like enzyme